MNILYIFQRYSIHMPHIFYIYIYIYIFIYMCMYENICIYTHIFILQMHMFSTNTTDMSHTRSIHIPYILYRYFRDLSHKLYTYFIHVPYLFLDIRYFFSPFDLDILYMCLTYPTQILHMFPTYAFIPTQIVSHVGPRGLVQGPKWQQAGPGPGPRRIWGPGVRGMYAVSTRRVAILRTAHRTAPTPIPPTYSIHLLHIFKFPIHVQCISHTYSIYSYIFHAHPIHITYCSIHIPYIFHT